MTDPREVVIADGPYRATIQTAGATLRTFEFGEAAVIDGFGAAELPEAGHGQVLAPWPNRLHEGRWNWRGTGLRLPVDEPDRGRSASHGLARWLVWTVAQQDSAGMTLTVELAARPGYPFWLELRSEYRVGTDGLAVTVSALNTGSSPAPVALGAHPYLLPTMGLDAARLSVPAAAVLEFDEHGVTSGPRPVAGSALDLRTGTALAGRALNHTLGDLERGADGRVRCVLEDGDRVVELWAGQSCRWLQIYTGDALSAQRRRRSVAVEPMTAPPQALASGVDLTVLDPGEELKLEWGLRVLR